MTRNIPRRRLSLVVSHSATGGVTDLDRTGDTPNDPPEESPFASVDELRAAVVMLRAELAIVVDGAPAGAGTKCGLCKLKEELDKDEPAGPIVRARWKQARASLDRSRHAANIAQITALIIAVFDTD